MNINFKDYITSPNPVILDIGTHNGDDSIMFLELFPTAQVHAFEADLEVCDIFVDNILKNVSKIEACPGSITLTRKAVGDVDGKLVFYGSIDTKHDNIAGPSGTFQKPTRHLDLHPHVQFREIEVDCIKLDTWFAEKNIDIIDFAWTDVNGAEVALVNGALDTFNNHTRYLQLECVPYELWENQSNVETLLGLLPNFELILTEGVNILLKNKSLV
jgi:FkbM family methyltransferase